MLTSDNLLMSKFISLFSTDTAVPKRLQRVRPPARSQAVTVRPGPVAVGFPASAPGWHLVVIRLFVSCTLLVSHGVIVGRTHSIVPWLNHLNTRAFVSSPPLPTDSCVRRSIMLQSTSGGLRALVTLTSHTCSHTVISPAYAGADLQICHDA